MSDEPVFRRPNWTPGMLLSPWHLLQQDAAMAAAATWQLRHLKAEFGLVGPGLRRTGEHGHPARDPQLAVNYLGDSLEVVLSWVRAITPDGMPLEVSGVPVKASFKRAEFVAAASVLVHAVVEAEDVPIQSTIGQDESNPTAPAFRQPKVVLRLDLPPDLEPRAVVVGQLKRVSGNESFQVDPAFIPVSVSMAAHSLLYHGWRGIKARAGSLAAEYSEMHRTIARFIEDIAPRIVNGKPIDTRPDLEVLSFVERSVLALDDCAYDTIDPSSTPSQFFSAIDRTIRRVALALDLSPATRSYFRILARANASYGVLLDDDMVLTGQRALTAYADLAHALQHATRSLNNLQLLLGALSGKYVDFRINRGVQALHFMIDSNGDKFFVAVDSPPPHSQRQGDMRTFVFNQLKLPAGHEYRVVLVGTDAAKDFTMGDSMNASIRMNAAMGAGGTITRTVKCEFQGQRNFAVDFEASAGIASIVGIEVTVSPAERITDCLLFQRKLELRVDTAAGGSGDGQRLSGSQMVTPPQPSTIRDTRTPTSTGATKKIILNTSKKPDQS